RSSAVVGSLHPLTEVPQKALGLNQKFLLNLALLDQFLTDCPQSLLRRNSDTKTRPRATKFPSASAVILSVQALTPSEQHMASISSLGLSGLPLSDLLADLRKVEEAPLQLLADRKTSFETKISGYGIIKSTLSSLQSSVKTLGETGSYNALKKIGRASCR